MDYWVRTRDQITENKNEDLIVFVWTREELEASVEDMTDDEWEMFLEKVRDTNHPEKLVRHTKAMKSLRQADVDLEASLFDLVEEVKKGIKDKKK